MNNNKSITSNRPSNRRRRSRLTDQWLRQRQPAHRIFFQYPPRLDKECDCLVATEKDIKNCLRQLEQEEATLRLALEQSSTSLKEQRQKEAKRKEEEAVARLENALMMDVDDSDDSSCV